MSDEEVVERDYTAEATEQGWREDGPLDAQAFVEKGEKIAGILKSKNNRLENRIATLEKSNIEFGEYHKQTLASQKQQNAERVAALEGQLAQAVTDGDGEKFQKTRNEIESLKPVPIQDSSQDSWNQLSQDWTNDNKWYSENRKLGAYADGISDQIRSEGYSGKAYFSEITKRVREDFPEEFDNPNKSKAGAVEAGGPVTEVSKAKTYESLPADAKAACDGFVKDGFMTKEDYVKNYEFEGV